MNWSQWALDAARSSQDPQEWHVYRAELSDGQYNGNYEQKQFPKLGFPYSQQLIELLNSSQAQTSINPRTNEQVEGDLTTRLQGLGLAQYSSPSSTTSSNPFRTRSTAQNTGYNLFVAQRNNVQGYSAQPTATSNPFHNLEGTSGYLPPVQANLDRRTQPPDRHGRRRSNTPAIGHNQPQQYAANLRRPQSAQDWSSSRSSDHASALSRSGSNLKGMKPQRQKDWKGFYKAGRVFRALWTQTAELNNPFSETLIFVVIMPHTNYSTCLAIHTYRNKGTTSRHARPSEHLVIYTGDKQPGLVEGESEVVLEKPPVRVYLDPKAEALREASRLALSKLHTVGHDVPVALIGKIASRDVDRIRQYAAKALGVVSSIDGGLDDLAEEDEEEQHGR